MRSEQSLGPILAERAQTLGRHTATVSASYTHIDFNTLDGQSLSSLTFTQPALSQAVIDRLPPLDARFKDDVLRTRLNLGLSYDLLFLTAAYGITGIPTIVLIGPDGKILFTSVGFADKEEEHLAELIDGALPGK